MIIVTRSGQLGNQIFQLGCALAERGDGERVYISDIPDFVRCFELPPHVREFRLRRNAVGRVLLRSVLRLAARGRVLSVIEEEQHEDGRIARRRKSAGLLPLTWINGGFFQDSWSARATAGHFPVFRSSVLAAAREWIARHCNPAEQRIFCHLRRADYLNFEGTGINVALPLSYYQAGLARLLPGRGAFKLLLASDDVEFAELAFATWPDAVVVREDACLTLAILSLCDAGVISNSSYSWWAGQLVARQGGRVIAPRNWLGWGEGECQPPGIEDPAFEWLEVPVIPRAVNDCRDRTAMAAE